jgi:hypothetical protein
MMESSNTDGSVTLGRINMGVKENLKSLLEDREKNTEIVPFSFADVKIEAVGTDKVQFDLGNDSYLVGTSAFSKLCNDLGVPSPYAKKIDKELFDFTFNHLATVSDHFSAAMVTNGTIRAFTDPGLPTISGNAVLNVLESTFDGDYDLRYVKVGDTNISFSLLPAQYQESIDGSNLFGGMRVSFSDSWVRNPVLDTYIWRELCSNGMIDELDGHKFRVSGKSEDQILAQIADYASLSLEKIPVLFDNFKKLLLESVDDYQKIVARICTEYRLPSKVKDRLLYYAVDPNFLITISNQEIVNMHDIVNLLTYVGTHDVEGTTEENRERLLSIAGSLTLSHDERCGSCGLIL